MTRMWLLDPGILCDNHLLGEHKELHQLVGHINAGNTAVLEGHADRQQIDTSKIRQRHRELVEEMDRRGFNHQSPMEYEDDLELGQVDMDENLEDLIDRCDECRKRYEKQRAGD